MQIPLGNTSPEVVFQFTLHGYSTSITLRSQDMEKLPPGLSMQLLS